MAEQNHASPNKFVTRSKRKRRKIMTRALVRVVSRQLTVYSSSYYYYDSSAARAAAYFIVLITV